MPLPNEDTTPPVTKIYFVSATIVNVKMGNSKFVAKIAYFCESDNKSNWNFLIYLKKNVERSPPQARHRGARTSWHGQADDLTGSRVRKYYSSTTELPDCPDCIKRTTQPFFWVGLGMDCMKPTGRKKRKTTAAREASRKQPQLGDTLKIYNNLYINLHTSFEREKSWAQIRDSQRIYVSVL